MLVIEKVDLFDKSIRVVPRVYPVSIIRGGFLFFTGVNREKDGVERWLNNSSTIVPKSIVIKK